MDYGDLKDDKDIQEKLGNLHKSVEKIEDMLKATLKPELYETMDLKQKVDYDLFMGYTLNTLFWLYMKTKGLDPGQSELKTQLNRIKQYMIQAKQAHERNTIRPKLDKPAAERFVKHSITIPKEGGQKRKRELDD